MKRYRIEKENLPEINRMLIDGATTTDIARHFGYATALSLMIHLDRLGYEICRVVFPKGNRNTLFDLTKN